MVKENDIIQMAVESHTGYKSLLWNGTVCIQDLKNWSVKINILNGYVAAKLEHESSAWVKQSSCQARVRSNWSGNLPRSRQDVQFTSQAFMLTTG